MTRNLFRLSILQLLVAMAVVAGFVAANRVGVRNMPSDLLELQEEFGLKGDLFTEHTGWPFVFHTTSASDILIYRSDDDFHVGTRESKFLWFALVGNIVVGVIAVATSVLGVGAVIRRDESAGVWISVGAVFVFLLTWVLLFRSLR
jgi:hypothetical protein